MGTRALQVAWILFCLALPLSIAGANGGWALACLVMLLSGNFPYAKGKSRLSFPIAAYCAAAAIASALGTDPAHSFRFLHQDLHKAWLCFFFSVGLAGLAAEQETRMLAALALGFVVECAVGLAQAASIPAGGVWIRPHAFVHPVTFGELTAFGLLGAFCFAAGSDSEDSGLRPWAWALLAVCAAGLFFNQTRGAIAGACAGLLALAAISPRLRLVSASAGAAAAAAMVASDFLPTGRSLIRGLSRLGPSGTPQMDRLKLWRVAIKMFLDHPWTGVGVNNFRANFTQYFTGLINNEPAMGTAHNLYLHQMAERGLLGLGALLFLFLAFWRGAYARAVNAPNPWTLWAFAATAAFSVMNLTETALQTEQVWMCFFFIWIWAEKHGQCECRAIEIAQHFPARSAP